MRFSRFRLFGFSWAFDWMCRIVYGWVGWFWGGSEDCILQLVRFILSGMREIGIPRLSSL